MDLHFDNRVSVPETYCLLQLEDGLCPSLRSLKLSYYGTDSEPSPLDPLLLLPDILRSRFLHSVIHDIYHGVFAGPVPKFQVMMDHVDKGLLRNLKLSGYPPNDHSYLSSFRNLQSFTLNHGQCNIIEILNSLAPLQTLKHLSLALSGSSTSFSSTEQNLPRDICPVLVELSISGNHDWMHHFLDSLAGGQIKTIAIITTGTNYPGNFVDIYQRLARLSSLQKISHTWGYDMWSTFSSYEDSDLDNIMPIREEIIPIIYPISRLMHLENLQFYTWIPFTDNDISALATAFPTLKELCISSSSIHRRPTFNSLCSLASACPNLTRLTITVDVKTIPSNVIPSFHHLKHLHVEVESWDVHRPSFAAFAVFFDTLFPYLRCFTFKSCCYMGEEVYEMITTICQPAREAEKERLLRLVQRVPEGLKEPYGVVWD
jgi:hypothetical protein